MRLVGKWRRGRPLGFPDQPTPAQWTVANIGSANPAPNVSTADLTRGRIIFSTGGLSLETSHAFAYLPIAGQSIIAARLDGRVESVSGTTANAESGGICIRQTTASDSRYAALTLSGLGLIFQYRQANGGAVTYVFRDPPVITAPRYLRLVVQPGIVVPYFSTNGITWSTVGGSDVFPTLARMSLTGDVLYGVAAASGYNTGLTTTLTVDSVHRTVLA
jgi:hypothetical protein